MFQEKTTLIVRSMENIMVLDEAMKLELMPVGDVIENSQWQGEGLPPAYMPALLFDDEDSAEEEDMDEDESFDEMDNDFDDDFDDDDFDDEDEDYEDEDEDYDYEEDVDYDDFDE